jgi:cellulose synthase/poly-beta-1,6-N-acetylglucosamine synthase-like glycosyltransferase
MSSIYQSIWLIYQSDYLLLLFGVLVFDIPRYIISIFAMAVVPLRDASRRKGPQPTVSVVLSVFNGMDNLMDCLWSIHQQTFRPMEVILVNDGSLDGTRALATAARQQGLIDVFIHHGTRCGKSASINQAVRFAKGDLVLCLDHDVILARDAIEKLTAVFDDDQVAIASGSLTIRNNQESIWTSFQAIEYLISITVGRTFLDLFGAVSCCSGAFSIFRRNIYDAIGGNNTGPGEDFELTLRIRKLGYKARFVRGASASVEAATSFEGLVRQRLRWDRDALNIRMNQYHNLDLFRPREFLSDTLQILDFIIFELIPTTTFPFYILYIIIVLGPLALAYLTSIYVMILGIYVVGIAISALMTPHNLTLFDVAVVPIFPFYQGVIMKMVRFIAFAREVLFRDSRRDEYVPPRIRRALYGSEG